MSDDGFSSDSDEGSSVDQVFKLQFNQAVQKVQSETAKPDGVHLASHVMLSIYGLYKAATIGKCKEPKPGLLDQKGRAKWSAWTKVSDLSKAEAMAKYIELVKESYSWTPEEVGACSSTSKTSSSVMGGNAVSSFAMMPDEPNDADMENEFSKIFTWVKDNDVGSVEKWLEIGKNDPNIQDSEGLTLLHWSVDRGHVDLCKLLLRHGANPNIPDFDGETALDYAITCDYVDIVTLLRDKLEEFEKD